MSFCLPKFAADVFRQKLISGEIDPVKLSNLSSAERRAFFEKFLTPEHAKETNALFESKLLLKNQQQGLINWAKQLTGLKPELKRDLVTRVNKMTELLSPESERAFLEDLASQKLGMGVTLEEATKITKLAQTVERAKIQAESGDLPLREYGNKLLDFYEYTNSLKPTKTSDMILSAANASRTVQVLGDLGWVFRQGWGMMSRPELYKGIFKTLSPNINDPGFLFSEKSARNLKADIISDPDYALVKGKLRLPLLEETLARREEDFMNKFTSKIPGVKNIERGNAGIATYVRWTVAKKLFDIARLRGEDISKGSKAVTDIINSVHNFSGSGNLGPNDMFSNAAPYLNPVIYSSRGISAKINMLDPRNYFDPSISKTARIANARNLIGSLAATTALLQMAQLFGAKIEHDPRSSDFGKVIIGKNHIDVSGGNSSYAVLISRLITNQQKQGEKIVSLDKGYRPTKRSGVVLNFGRNKLAPMASTFADLFAGPIPYQDSPLAKAILGPGKNLDKFQLDREVINRTGPMIVNSIFEAAQTDDTGALLGILFDFFGSSYSAY